MFSNPERCPSCGADSKVINSKPYLNGAETSVIARKRERACRVCTETWMTFETRLDPNMIKTRLALPN